MAKIFYDHLVIREEITAELEAYNLSGDEKEELVRLVDETLHQEVLNVILTHLPKEKHQEFLNKFHQSPQAPQVLEYLKTEIADIEEIITGEAKRVKKEILEEIKKAKT